MSDISAIIFSSTAKTTSRIDTLQHYKPLLPLLLLSPAFAMETGIAYYHGI